MKLNNKGFTLVEMLAVVIILGVLAAIMVPTVTSMITKNQQDNFENLKKSITSAAKMYISDNRYNITLDDNICSDSVTSREIAKINDKTITNSKITVKMLIASDYLTNGEMLNEDKQEIDREKSYIKVTYNCATKKYIYEEPHLE